MKVKIGYPVQNKTDAINGISTVPTPAVDAPIPKTSAAPGNTLFKAKKQGLFSKNVLKNKTQ